MPSQTWRIVNVASASAPTSSWEVSTDGRQLICGCPGYLRQTHTPVCARHRNEPCTCRSVEASAKTTRCCRHTWEVHRRLNRIGGLARAMSYILQGRFMLSDLEAPVDAVAPSALFPLQGTVDRVARNGPDRVIVNHHCDGYTPEHARLVFNAVPEIIFVRRDGWSAGAPMALADDLLALWRSEWAATIDLRWTPHRIAVFTGSVPDGPPPLRPRSRVVTRETAERQAFAAQYEHGPISRPTLGLIILAESRVLARQAAHDDFGLSDEEWFYVVSVDALRRVGAHLQGSRYACVDGFYRRRENIECLEFLRASGAEEIVFRPRSDAERAAEPPPTRPPSGQRAIILRDED